VTRQLQTTRLSLTPVSLDDAPFIQAEFPHWDIVEFMNNRVPWPYPEDGAVTFLRDVLLPQIARGEGHAWIMRLRDAAATPIGMINLRIGTDENRGFWVARARQRRGYITEAADAVTDYYFNVLDQPELRVAKAVDNAASRAISVRQGMRLISTEARDYVSGRHKTEIWTITRNEWQDRPRQKRRRIQVS
jgi:RimJ/RimL family protein N-acetyltransferase